MQASDFIPAAYYPALRELECVLSAARSAPGKRKLRRLERMVQLYRCYMQLVAECCPVLSRYHGCPVLVVNRFWAGLNITQLFLCGTFPAAQDFFDWYCDSRTIGFERRFEGMKTLLYEKNEQEQDII